MHFQRLYNGPRHFAADIDVEIFIPQGRYPVVRLRLVINFPDSGNWT
jgi:hypothetical protein